MPLIKQAQSVDQMVFLDLNNIYPIESISHTHHAEDVAQPVPVRGISLFTGAGGMDVGFSCAGIQVKIANELVPYACDTYEANHPDTKLLRGDISDYYRFFFRGRCRHCFWGTPLSGFFRRGQDESRR